MFKKNTIENKDVILNPTFFNEDVFEEILDYLYTFKINLREQNLIHICILALHIADKILIKKTEDYLKKKMSKENVYNYFELAAVVDSEELKVQCVNFIAENFEEMERQNLISRLSLENLKMILEKWRDRYKYEKMFYFVIAWAKADEDKRKSSLFDLMKSHIPLRKYGPTFLKEVVYKQKIFMNNAKFLKLFLETASIVGYDCSSTYVFGGRDGTELSSVSKFESSTGKWSEITSKMTEKRSHFDCAVVKDKVYLCGGWNGQRNVNVLEVFDAKTQTFQTLAPMKHSRQSCAVVALEGFLYVAGGHDGEDPLNCVEKYSIETNQWQEVQSMQEKRNGLKLVELGGKLYALGGFNGSEYLNTIECYDPEENRWEFKSNMTIFELAAVVESEELKSQCLNFIAANF